MWLSHQIGKMQLLLVTFWQNDKSNFHIVIVFSKTLSYLGFRSISDGFPLVYIYFTVNNEQTTLNNSLLSECESYFESYFAYSWTNARHFAKCPISHIAHNI